MAEVEETLEVEKAVERLNGALRLQYRSALQYSLASATLTGIEGQAISNLLVDYGDEELQDVRRLIEKIVSLGGEPTSEVAELRHPANTEEALGWLVESEREAIDALQGAIEPTGREGRSEALEHRLEHIIMRKQEQVDRLLRAQGGD